MKKILKHGISLILLVALAAGSFGFPNKTSQSPSIPDQNPYDYPTPTQVANERSQRDVTYTLTLLTTEEYNALRSSLLEQNQALVEAGSMSKTQQTIWTNRYQTIYDALQMERGFVVKTETSEGFVTYKYQSKMDHNDYTGDIDKVFYTITLSPPR